MAALFNAPFPPDLFGIPGDDIAPEDSSPDLEDCGAGLSEEALLHWPEFAGRSRQSSRSSARMPSHRPASGS